MFTVFLSPTKNVMHPQPPCSVAWWLTINTWTVNHKGQDIVAVETRSTCCIFFSECKKSFITVLLSLSALSKKHYVDTGPNTVRRRRQMSHSVATFIISWCRLLLIKTLNVLWMKFDELYDLLLLHVPWFSGAYVMKNVSHRKKDQKAKKSIGNKKRSYFKGLTCFYVLILV